MGALLVTALFTALAALAIAFAVLPLLRDASEPPGKRALLATSMGLAVLGVAAGFYIALGRPELALRAVQPAEKQDINGLIALLVTRVHREPGDTTSWIWLARAYETVGDPADAARAMGRAVVAAQKRHALNPALLTAYGQTLVRAAAGLVTPEAESAFATALRADPKEPAARYYLGFAHASRRENAQALALWSGLVGDLPPKSALRAELIDRMAALTAKSGGTPDISAMVQGLDARLRAQPDDPEGWQRLIRAYSVLGDKDRARDALARARIALVKQPDVLSALAVEARELKLQ